jgi:hypothetical protein
MMDARIKSGHDDWVCVFSSFQNTVSRSRGAMRPSYADSLRLLKIRGRRECRALNAPAASRAKIKKHTSVVTTVTPDKPGIPRAMVLTVSFVLSPVYRAC